MYPGVEPFVPHGVEYLVIGRFAQPDPEKEYMFSLPCLAWEFQMRVGKDARAQRIGLAAFDEDGNEVASLAPQGFDGEPSFADSVFRVWLPHEERAIARVRVVYNIFPDPDLDPYETNAAVDQVEWQ